jgi:hypothetical protein
MIKHSCLLISLLFVVFSAHGWNDLGHRTVAELAWRQVNPKERQAASELLRQHPHYRSLLVADVPAKVDTNEWAFLSAALWPDRVRPAKAGQAAKPRSVTKYNVFPHGIDLPFVRASETNDSLLKKFVVKNPNAATVIDDSLATLRNRNASAHDRAVSLCWVLHLFGDLHQPLHAATLVTCDKPAGTGSGGACLVRDRAGKNLNLHAFWDQLPGASLSYSGVTALADELSAAPGFNPGALKAYRRNKSAASWGRESHNLAVEFAYAEQWVQWADAAAVKSGAVKRTDIPQLSADYVYHAQELARLRLALAAQRLTEALKHTW